MTATGVSKQEKKIEAMADVVDEVHPGLTHLSVKGVFRFAIKEALKEHGFSEWKDVAAEPASIREKFFKSLCDHAIPRVVNLGLPEEKTEQLKAKLQEMNRQYVVN
jgi:DnaJ-domain-containing protein 1